MKWRNLAWAGAGAITAFTLMSVLDLDRPAMIKDLKQCDRANLPNCRIILDEAKSNVFVTWDEPQAPYCEVDVEGYKMRMSLATAQARNITCDNTNETPNP